MLVGSFHGGGVENGERKVTIPTKLTPSHLDLATVLSWGPRGRDFSLELLCLKWRGQCVEQARRVTALKPALQLVTPVT